ncbi:hypothetical protein D3C80_2237540 [compost metagenome]
MLVRVNGGPERKLFAQCGNTVVFKFEGIFCLVYKIELEPGQFLFLRIEMVYR